MSIDVVLRLRKKGRITQRRSRASDHLRYYTKHPLNRKKNRKKFRNAEIYQNKKTNNSHQDKRNLEK